MTDVEKRRPNPQTLREANSRPSFCSPRLAGDPLVFNYRDSLAQALTDELHDLSGDRFAQSFHHLRHGLFGESQGL